VTFSVTSSYEFLAFNFLTLNAGRLSCVTR